MMLFTLFGNGLYVGSGKFFTWDFHMTTWGVGDSPFGSF